MTDYEFIENIRLVTFNNENWERAKRLVAEGKLVYECGYGYGRFVKPEDTTKNYQETRTKD